MKKSTSMRNYRLVIASENPTKVNSARDAFVQVFMPEIKGDFLTEIIEMFKDFINPDHLEIVSVSVPSLVPEQPRGEEETRTGAMNRLLAVKKMHPKASAWVSIEGGVIVSLDRVTEINVILVSVQGIEKIFEVETPKFEISYKTADHVRNGMELGPANDLVFGQKNSKQAGGMVGIVTSQLVTRYDIYYQSLLIAFAQIRNTHLYSRVSIPAQS
jgi:inosine/xanthosine triphosphatase